MRKPQIIIGILLGVVLLVVGACAPTPTPAPELEPAPPPAEPGPAVEPERQEISFSDPDSDLFNKAGISWAGFGAYIDITESELSLSNGYYLAKIELSSPLPTKIQDPAGVIEWDILIDSNSDPGTGWHSPLLFNDIGVDYYLCLALTKSGYKASAQDVKTHAQGSIEYEIDGNIVELRFPPETIGKPDSFNYIVAVRKYAKAGDPNTLEVADKAPNEGHYVFPNHHAYVEPAPTPAPALAYTRNYVNIAGTDKMLVGAFYYPWYSPSHHWREGYANSPIRGEYNSRDQNVINAHIDEATGHGIDFFAMSWWGPNSWEDITLRDYFLKAQLVSDIKIVILYETVGRLRVEDGKVNLDDETNKQILIDDFKYLSENYFRQSSYLTVNGKPVVFIYSSRIFSGDIEGTLAMLRQESRQNGYELFLIGDEVYWQSPFDESVKKRIKLYDAVTAYNMHASVSDIDVNFVSKASEHYKKWKTVADQLGIEFVPDVLPGFDDTKVRPQEKHPVIRRTVEKFDSFIQSVLPLVGKKNILLITSYNEWHEGTEIEPSNEHGASYLEIIKDRVVGYR